ncbi:MAG: c-type cytochrome [Deltaproteobacteria bacterium]|jgi:cytochrome c|nr:c-type cytochrome [Deltaproteobacteria bacterium]
MIYRIGLTAILLIGFCTLGCSGDASSNTSKSPVNKVSKSDTKVSPKPKAAPVEQVAKKLEPGDASRGEPAFGACVACHGEQGAGDGAAAGAMKPKPRDLSDKKWQAGVEDEYLKKVILGGGMTVGKSPLMPANPGLGNDPQKLADLIAFIRSLAN